MGNSSAHSASHRKRRNSSSRRNSIKGVDANVEKFFASKGLNNSDITVQQILSQFSQSFIIKTILVDNVKEGGGGSEKGLKVEVNQVKEIFSELFEGYSNTALIESYLNILFEPSNENEFEFVLKVVESVFQDCLIFSLKAVGFKKPNLSDYAKKTLNSLVRSIQFTNEGGKMRTSQSNIKDWIMNNFPLLFYGFNHWLTSKIKEQKPAEIQDTRANDLSHFMNLTMVWYLISNLQNCYTKDLASENGTLFEKLRNCLTESRWHPLYQSENHGLSLNRFQTNLFNYKAGTMVFIFLKTGSLYCICSNDEYKESPTAYGDEQTRIFRIWDEFKEYEVGSSGNIYLNTKSRFLKLGLIFGYSNQVKPVLKISEDLHWADHELNSNDEIISVEGWACGSTKAAADQMNMKKWESKQLEKMRTVNRNVAGGWGEEKAILDMAGVKTEHSERGDI